MRGARGGGRSTGASPGTPTFGPGQSSSGGSRERQHVNRVDEATRLPWRDLEPCRRLREGFSRLQELLRGGDGPPDRDDGREGGGALPACGAPRRRRTSEGRVERALHRSAGDARRPAAPTRADVLVRQQYVGPVRRGRFRRMDCCRVRRDGGDAAASVPDPDEAGGAAAAVVRVGGESRD